MDATGPSPPMQQAILKWRRIAQTLLYKTTIFPVERWTFFFLSLLLYSVRVYYIQGYHIISYALGIYLLNLVIGFLSPSVDPEEEEDGPSLPSAPNEEPADGEFRPFSRKLPEFKFWCAGAKAVWISIVCTLFKFMDLPVFWPILLMYFMLLVFITMKDRVRHMIKYQYVPWDWGKMTYKQTYADASKVDLNQVAGGNEKAK